MAVNEERLRYLFDLYQANEATDEEVKEFFYWISQAGNDALVKSMLLQLIEKTEESSTYDTQHWDAVLQKVLKQDAKVIAMRPKKVVTLGRVAAAAVIVLLLSVSGYFIFNKRSTFSPSNVPLSQLKGENDVAPGGNKAILTLANGTQIILDSAANGTLTRQGNTKIIKLDSGQLAYQSAGHPELVEGESVGFNTITTPRGGQYQIILADGSKVWLNAASSLKFPAAFAGKERNVALTGEGYFEVAHDATKPFKVSVNGTEVRVLGTHFNINAYDDESGVKTTLLEGSVKVSEGSTSKMIKPGEQAQVQNQGITIQVVNTNEAVAWKNGQFMFINTDIKTIMQQFARWYDVEIVYDGDVTSHFVATIPRNVSAMNAFKILEQTGGVHFEIQGKKVIVRP